jgi:hypothetical protein
MTALRLPLGHLISSLPWTLKKWKFSKCYTYSIQQNWKAEIKIQFSSKDWKFGDRKLSLCLICYNVNVLSSLKKKLKIMTTSRAMAWFCKSVQLIRTSVHKWPVCAAFIRVSHCVWHEVTSTLSHSRVLSIGSWLPCLSWPGTPAIHPSLCCGAAPSQQRYPLLLFLGSLGAGGPVGSVHL